MHPVRRGEAKYKEDHAMREQEHDLCLLSALALIMGGMLSALVACTPVQGYSGLERPQAEVALVTIARRLRGNVVAACTVTA